MAISIFEIIWETQLELPFQDGNIAITSKVTNPLGAGNESGWEPGLLGMQQLVGQLGVDHRLCASHGQMRTGKPLASLCPGRLPGWFLQHGNFIVARLLSNWFRVPKACVPRKNQADTLLTWTKI